MTIRSYLKSFLLGLCLVGSTASIGAMNFVRSALRRYSLPAVAMGTSLCAAYQLGKKSGQNRELVKIKDFNYPYDVDFARTVIKQNYRCYSLRRESMVCSYCPSWLKFSALCPDIGSEVAKRWQFNKYAYDKILWDTGRPAGVIRYSKFRPYIELLGVDASFRRRGYAKKLLEQALEYYKNKGFKEVTLVVKADGPESIAAQRLYNKLGFKEYDRDSYWLHLKKDIRPSAVERFFQRLLSRITYWYSDQM